MLFKNKKEVDITNKINAKIEVISKHKSEELTSLYEYLIEKLEKFYKEYGKNLKLFVNDRNEEFRKSLTLSLPTSLYRKYELSELVTLDVIKNNNNSFDFLVKIIPFYEFLQVNVFEEGQTIDDKYFSDYDNEPIGGGNPYYRCSHCKISDPQINGKIRNHADYCEYRIQKEIELGISNRRY